MSKKSIANKRNRLGIVGKVILVALVLAGMGTAGYTAVTPDEMDVLLPEQIRIFDPFDLSSTTIVTAGESGILGAVDSGEILILADRPEIRIPLRPALRSPFRPPLS